MVKAVQLRRDNDKGLGFTVSEGEQGGKPVVIVTKIVPGGPAEQGGQLQVGDQVLSVDGQNILGYSYEKVSVWGGGCVRRRVWGGGCERRRVWGGGCERR